MNLDAAQLLNIMTHKKQKLELKKHSATTEQQFDRYSEKIDEMNLVIDVINHEENSLLSIQEKFEQEC